MKIAVINIDDSLGGASMACIRLAEAINNEEGVEVDILVQKKTLNLTSIKPIGNGPFWKLKTFIRFVLERLYFFLFEKSKEIRFAYSPAFAGIDITKKVDFSQYDIIHLHWINFGFLSLKSLHKITRLGKPIVWSMHDMWPFTGGCHYSNDCLNYEKSCGNCSQFLKHPAANDLSHKHFLKKKLAYNKNAKMHFIGSSKWLGDLGKNSGLLRTFKVSDIPTVVSSSFRLVDKSTCRQELSLPEDKKLILFVAMIIADNRKGFSYLSDALQLLSKEKQCLESIELVVIGNANGIHQDDLPFKTHLLGKITDMEKLNKVYNASDVFVIPSTQDNLPNTVMEALSTGTPCVGFKVGGIPEMIDHLTNGYVSDYKSTESLASGMKWILNHKAYQLLSENAIKKAKSTYSAKAVSAKYMKVYKDLLEN
ncbi:MAG: glycosyltransferase involved in cell wall biosynthesis [Arcticibacterium sp.]|jgi:glycosyltransferase involved in cell wall biosynthesis